MFASIQTIVKRMPVLILGALAALIFFTAITPIETSFVPQAFAAGLGIDDELVLDVHNDETEFKVVFVSILNKFLLLLGIVLLFVIIYAGVSIIVSDGEEEALTKGRKMIIYAIIGVIIIALSYSIVNWIDGLTGSADQTGG